MSAAAVTLGDEERRLLADEVARFHASLATPEARERYRRLAEAVAPGQDSGQIPTELLPALEDLLEIALASGEVRRFHGPAGEQTLAALFARTPRGAELEAGLAGVNRALTALAGQRIQRLAFQSALPGRYQLLVETELCQLRLEVDRHGISGKDVALGG